jgi:hypothetical protein
MTDKQINAAIARECGWTEIRDNVVGKAPGETANRVMFLPDYCTDLNAMHEAERVLNYEQCEAFSNAVADIVCATNREKDYPFPWQFARIHATARHRAEAFLRTLGKWEEGE